MIVDVDETVPASWIVVHLRDIAEVRLGRQRSPDKATGDYMRPYLRAANVTWAGLDLSDIKQMNFDPRELEVYALHKDDIVLGEASGSAAEVGKPAIWNNEIQDCCLQNTLIRVRAQPGLAPFLLHHFVHDARSGRFASASRGIGIHHLGAEALSEWPVALPPIPEQHRIVAKLEALTEKSRRAKEALDAIPPLLERFRQSVLAAAFRGDLTAEWRAKNPDVEPADKLLQRIRTERRRRWEEAELAKMQAKGKTPGDDRWKEKYEEPEPVDTEGLPELPEGWTWANIKLIAPLQAGFAFSSSGFQSHGIRLLKGVNVRDGWIATDELNCWNPDSAALYDQFRLSRGDVVIAMDRPVYSSGTKATKVARLDDSWHGSLLLQRVGRFCAVPSLDRAYLYLWLQGGRFRDYLIGEQNGSQDGKDLPHVSGGVIDVAIVPVPPLQEQVVIEAIVTARLASVKTVSAMSADVQRRWSELNRSILAKAFRGDLVPQDPADEPASVLLDRIRAERAAAELAKDTTKKKSPRRPR